MKNVSTVLFGLLFLQGCALPLPVQIATLAFDGVSYLTTKKSIADHGLSLAAGEDCAMWRGLAGEAICVDDDAAPVMLAANETAPGESDDTLTSDETAPGESDDALTSYETAAIEPVQAALLPASAKTDGDASSRVVVWLDEPQQEASQKLAVGGVDAFPASLPPATAGVATAEEASAGSGEGMQAKIIPVAATAVAPTVESPQAPKLELAELARGAHAPNGIYYVIGSFRDLGNAQRLAGRHPALEPSVITAALDGAVIYRVVVGPFTAAERLDARRRLLRDGIYDAWAITLDSDAWRVTFTIPLRGNALASLDAGRARSVSY